MAARVHTPLSTTLRNLELGTVSGYEVLWCYSYKTQCISTQRQRRLARPLASGIGA